MKKFFLYVLYPIIIFCSSSFLLFAEEGNAFDKSNLISLQEFRSIINDVPKFDFQCEDIFSNNQSWLDGIKLIKIKLNVEGYLNNIRKKIKNSSFNQYNLNIVSNSEKNWLKYKKAKINFNQSDCFYDAEFRLTGDTNLHVGLPGELPHSIKIKLKKGRLENITKFKLFRPESRSGKYELLISLINKELGFISPRTAFGNLQIGNETFRVLFQEDISKDLLEDNLFHEGIIIEGDEYLRPFSTPRIVNRKVLNNKEIKNISENILHLIGSVYYNTNKASLNINKENPSDIPLLIDYIPEENRDIFILFHLLNFAFNSSGGLTRDDSKMMYDFISRKFYPIFYDGHYSIDSQETYPVNFYFDQNHINILLKKINTLETEKLFLILNEYGADFSKNEIRKILSDAIFFLVNLKNNNTHFQDKSIKNINTLEYIKIASNSVFDNVDIKQIQLAWLDKNKIIKNCLIKSSDRICDVDNQIKLDSFSNYQNYNKLIFLYGLESIKESSLLSESIPRNTIQLKDSSTKIEYTNNLQISIDYTKRKITIKNKFHNKNISQLKFFDGHFKNWDIYVKGDTALGYPSIKGTRMSVLGLTGCITFNDINLQNININIENSNCEDAVHFVRATGNISQLLINNSKSDALDADFSNLNFENVIINNASGDCVDLSKGIYKMKKIQLYNCNDKGVSSGERANVDIDQLTINTALLGVASKDESNLIIKNANIKNAQICYAIYKKKQKYGVGSIKFDENITCDITKRVYINKFHDITANLE